MNNSLEKIIEILLSRKHKKQKMRLGTTVVSLFLSLIILYLNVFPAVTMTDREAALMEEKEYEIANNIDSSNYTFFNESLDDGDIIDVSGNYDEFSDGDNDSSETPIEETTNEEITIVDIGNEETEETTSSKIEEETFDNTENITDIQEENSEESITSEETTSISEENSEESLTLETTTSVAEDEEEISSEETIIKEDNAKNDILNASAATSLYQRIDITSATNIVNGEYLLVCNANYGNYLVTGTNVASGSTKGLRQQAVSVSGDYVSGDLDQHLWKFTRVRSESRYYYNISNGSNYMYIGGANNVTTRTSRQNITTALQDTNCISLYANSNYLNCFGGGSNGYFSGYSVADSNTYFMLYKKVEGSELFYDINVPSYSRNGTGWKITPTLAETVQSVTQGSKIFSKPDGYYDEVGSAGVAGLYRQNIYDGYEFTNTNNVNTYLDGFEYYKEFGFEGWTTTDTSGNNILILPDSDITINSDGTIGVVGKTYELGTDNCVEAIGSELNNYTISRTSVLKGAWRKVSSPVYFFVNYKAAILDKEGDVSGRGTAEFTDVIAVGTLLFGTHVMGGDGDYARATSTAISSMITSEQNFDYDLGETKIIIKYATIYDNGNTKINNSNPDINQRELEESLLNWIRADDSINIYVCTDDDKTAPIDNANATAENYSVRWYVLKEQIDGWHIDGVLVSATKELTVTKSFKGMDDSDINTVLNNFAIDVGFGGGNYLTLKKDQSVEGQYSYLGFDSTTKTAAWSIRVPMGETLELQEHNFESNHYDTTYTTVVVDGNTDNLILDSDTHVGNVMSGINRNIAFTNFYVSRGKGCLAIVKKDAADDRPLRGAIFKLEDKDNPLEYSHTAISNYSGILMFEDLQPGHTYILSEVSAPTGYNLITESREVTVSDVSGNIIVSLDSNEYYNEGDKVVKLYEVKNSAEQSSVKIKKVFEGLTHDEISKLNGYHIDYKIGSRTGTLNTSNAAIISENGYTYEWNINNIEAGTNIELEEKEYNSSAYDTVNVKSEFNGVGIVPDVTDNSVKLSAVKTENNDEFVITNSYSNSFILKVLKKDANDENKNLEGAEFKLYGSHREAINTNDRITVDYDGKSENYYYMRTATTDSTGVFMTEGLEPTNIYYLVETQAPSEYNLDSTPIRIDINDGSSIITNGIFEKVVYNSLGSGPIKFRKSWRTQEGVQLPENLKFMLFRRLGEDGDAEFISEYIVPTNGSNDIEYTINGPPGQEDEGFKWYSDDGQRYYYYITEEPVANFAISFDSNDTVLKFRYNEEIYYGVLAEPSGNEKTIYNVYTNVPEAGGNFKNINIAVGIIEIIMVWLLYIKINFCKREGRTFRNGN